MNIEVKSRPRPPTLGGVICRSVLAVVFGALAFFNISHGAHPLLWSLDLAAGALWTWSSHHMYRRLNPPPPKGVSGNDVRK